MSVFDLDGLSDLRRSRLLAAETEAETRAIRVEQFAHSTAHTTLQHFLNFLKFSLRLCKLSPFRPVSAIATK